MIEYMFGPVLQLCMSKLNTPFMLQLQQCMKFYGLKQKFPLLSCDVKERFALIIQM
jgi:hypothetical protein